MENLTNFDALVYIYLVITLGTLLYPIELWLRVNFVNFIFIVIFTVYVISSQSIIETDFSVFLRDDFLDFYYILGAIVTSWILYLRSVNNISLLDSLFLGILPYTILFLLFLENTLDGETINNYIGIITLYIIPYIFLTYKKMLFTIPFAVKGMSDRY